MNVEYSQNLFPEVICKIISDYNTDIFQWIPQDKIILESFYENPNATDYIDRLDKSLKYNIKVNILENDKTGKHIMKLYNIQPYAVIINTKHLMKNPNIVKVMKKIFYDLNPSVYFQYVARHPHLLQYLPNIYTFDPEHKNFFFKKDYNRELQTLNDSNCESIAMQYNLDLNNLNLKFRYQRIYQEIWQSLCKNPAAVKYIEQEYAITKTVDRQTPLLDWDSICANTKAGKILQEEFLTNHNSDKLNWDIILANPGIMRFIAYVNNNFPQKIKDKWAILCRNESAGNLLLTEFLKNPTSENHLLSHSKYYSSNKGAVCFIEYLYNNKFRKYVDVPELCNNEDAIDLLHHLLEREFEKRSSARFTNKKKIKKHNLLNIRNLCANKNALPLIKKIYENRTHRYLIEWHILSRNPGIFESKNIYSTLLAL